MLDGASGTKVCGKSSIQVCGNVPRFPWIEIRHWIKNQALRRAAGLREGQAVMETHVARVASVPSRGRNEGLRLCALRELGWLGDVGVAATLQVGADGVVHSYIKVQVCGQARGNALTVWGRKPLSVVQSAYNGDRAHFARILIMTRSCVSKHV